MFKMLLQVIIGWDPAMRRVQMVSVVFRLALGMLLLVSGGGKLRAPGLKENIKRIKADFVFQSDSVSGATNPNTITHPMNAPANDISKPEYLLPEPLLDIYLTTLPFVEIALGVLLILGLFTRPAALGTALLFVSMLYGKFVLSAFTELPGYFIFIGSAMVAYVCSVGDLWSLDGVFFRTGWRAAARKSARRRKKSPDTAASGAESVPAEPPESAEPVDTDKTSEPVVDAGTADSETTESDNGTPDDHA